MRIFLLLAAIIASLTGCMTVTTGGTATECPECRGCSGPSGDMDGDGAECTAADAGAFFQAFGKSRGEDGYIKAADYDRDGFVSSGDYAVFLSVCS